METIVLALVPEEPLYSQVKSMMERYSRDLGSYRALKLPPHITLANRFHTNRREELLGALRQWCQTQGPIQVTFEGIDKFTDPHLLYLKVQRTPELQEMHETAIEIAMQYGLPIRKEREEGLTAEQQELADKYGRFHVKQFYVPHLTLSGNDVDKERFMELAPVALALSSPIKHLTVLRKSEQWEIICRIPLGQDQA